MSEALKPCPFCGGEAIIKEAMSWKMSTAYSPECSVCPVRMDKGYRTSELAVAAWNTRKGGV